MSLAGQWNAWMESHLDNGISARIKASWERCRHWGVPIDYPLPQFQDSEGLTERRQRRAKLLPIADPHLTYLANLFNGQEFSVALSDENGIVLKLNCDPNTSAHPLFFPGADWSEGKIGTNGIGTALFDRKPVVIFGPQHYCKTFHTWTCTASPITTAQGNLLGAITVAVPDDQANPCILNLVTTATEAIATAYADQNLAGVMAASLVHEANNPLTIARGFVQLMAQADLPTQYTNYARMAIDAIDQTKDILINFSSMLKTPDRGEANTVELIQSLEQARQSIMPLTSQHNFSLPRVIRPGNIKVQGNPRLLQRVWINIYKNCLEAMDTGRIKTLITTQDNMAQVIISDNGPGIAQDIRSRIFEPFVTTKPTGSGLGLAVSREIVSLIGGSIRLTCPHRGGTIVTVKLPLAN